MTDDTAMVIVVNITEEGEVTSIETNIDDLCTDDLEDVFAKAITLFETSQGHRLH